MGYQVAIDDTVPTLEDALVKYFTPDVFDDSYHCAECGNLGKTEQRVVIRSLPTILCLVLQYDIPNLRRVKKDALLRFSLELHLPASCFRRFDTPFHQWCTKEDLQAEYRQTSSLLSLLPVDVRDMVGI